MDSIGTGFLITEEPTGHGGKEMKFLEIVYTRKP